MRSLLASFLSIAVVALSLAAPASAAPQRGAGHMFYSRSKGFVYWVTDSISKQDAHDLAQSLCNGSMSASALAQMQRVTYPKMGIWDAANSQAISNLNQPATDCQDVGAFTTWVQNHVCGGILFNNDGSIRQFVQHSTAQKTKNDISNRNLPWFFVCNDVAANNGNNSSNNNNSGNNNGVGALLALIGGVALGIAASHHHNDPAPTPAPNNYVPPNSNQPSVSGATSISLRNDTGSTQAYSVSCGSNGQQQYNIGAGATQSIDSSSLPGGPCSNFNVSVVNGGSANSLPGGGPYAIFTNANGVSVSNIVVGNATATLTIVNDTRQDQTFLLTCSGAAPQSFVAPQQQSTSPNMGCANGTFQLNDGSAVHNVTAGNTYHLQFAPNGAIVLKGP